jgi:hypothetical protein
MAWCGLRYSMILMSVREPRATVLEPREPALKLRAEPLQKIGPESINGDHHDQGWLARGQRSLQKVLKQGLTGIGPVRIRRRKAGRLGLS